ncbi:hypothetical protein Q4485_11380 [Granulosicoccaceae sp. 1_MG-2023]|nr:hypothetical protein [Granulosicoccaceae sp. 1_MG-2023]
MSKVAFPFLTLSDSLVECDGFLIGEPGHPMNKAEEFLQAWDYSRKLGASVTIGFDYDSACKALGFEPGDAALKLIFKMGTGKGAMPRRWETLTDRVVSASEDLPVTLTADLQSHTLSGSIRLRVEIVLASRPKVVSELSPKHPGSRLWAKEHVILIEDGGDSRFPVELVSFSESFNGEVESGALWYLQWISEDVDVDFSGAVRVYVNSDQEKFSERFVEGDDLTIHVLMFDVISQMIEAVIATERFDDLLPECEEGSVGKQVLYWLENAFPGRSLTEVRRLRTDNPARFRAAILASAQPGVFA